MIDAPDRAAAVRILVSRGISPRSVEDGAVAVKPRAAKGKRGAGSGNQDESANGTATVEKTNGKPRGKSGGNITAAEFDPSEVASAAMFGGMFARRSMSIAETGSFIRELATAVQAGLPIVPALRTLAKSGRTPRQRVMLNHLIEQVESGKTLHQAFASWGKPFTDLIISLTKAGEVSGKLAEVLTQAADLLERDLKLRRSVMSATLYPVILLVLAAIAVTIITTVIVPKILEPLKGQNIPLPLPTILVQGFANFVGSYWWAIMTVGALAALVFSRLHAQPGPRLWIDNMLVRAPLAGPIIRDAAVARFTRTLGTLVKSGLPVLTALRLTGQTMTNTALRGGVESVCDEVAGGKTIAEPLEATGIFPPLLIQIVSLGERSGKLPDLLTQAATSLEDRTETRVKVLTTILPPILVVMVACVIGVVVAAILLPLLDMQDAASRM